MHGTVEVLGRLLPATRDEMKEFRRLERSVG
jgi:hypothetical protein